MIDLKDYSLIITGAGSGIGLTTAALANSLGARVAGTVQGQAQHGALARYLDDEAIFDLDVRDSSAVDAAVQSSIDLFGKLDGAVAGAGIIELLASTQTSDDAWSRILDVNLTGTFLMCQAALPHLLQSKGAIVNTSSTSALAGLPYGAAYGASKAGVLALTYTLAIEYGRDGVRTNAVCPGSITTPMTAAPAFPEGAHMKLIMRAMPLDEFRGPETVASLIAFLASDDAAHVNGERIRVDGATLS